MRIESNSTALTFGSNYKPQNAEQAKEDLPEMKKQLAREEEKLQELLKKFENFGESRKLISTTTKLGGNFDATA